MVYVFAGVMAFLFLFLFDVFTLRNHIALKIIFGIIGVVLLVFSSVMTILKSPRINIPLPLRISSYLLCFMFILLLIYSLFLELPFSDTYGKEEHSSKLINTGTYALCRHPGVLWFGLAFFFGACATGAVNLAIGGSIWTLMDVLHVYIQEKVFFCRMFPDYKKYMKITPMLVPNLESFRRCMNTLRLGN